MQERPAHLPRRVKLKRSEFYTHYAVSIVLLAPTVAAIYSFVTRKYISSAIPDMRIFCACTIIASAFLAWFQTWALRFRVVETSEDARSNYQKVIEAIGKTDWHISQHRADSRIVATVPGAVTWGERVEVQFHGTQVYVNSICDPSKWPVLIAFGDNISHIAYIRDAVTDRLERSQGPSSVSQAGDRGESTSLGVAVTPHRSTSIVGVTAARNPITTYEPVFGGIVSVLAGAFLCFLLFVSSGSNSSHTGTAFLSIVCVSVMSWGVAQIVGSRKASRHPDKSNQQSPVLGTALGCVLVGLLLVPVTLMMYEFAPSHPSYMFVSGGVTVLLLVVGAIVGIRQGVWR
jgi:hypothetical protein